MHTVDTHNEESLSYIRLGFKNRRSFYGIVEAFTKSQELEGTRSPSYTNLHT